MYHKLLQHFHQLHNGVFLERLWLFLYKLLQPNEFIVQLNMIKHRRIFLLTELKKYIYLVMRY